MQSNQIVLAFLRETFQRIATSSPLFFKVWMGITGVFILITGVPEFLSMFEIQIPDLWNEKVTLVVKWVSRAMFFMSLLTNQSSAATVTKEGVVLTKTDESKLPFTARAEVKKAQVEQIPNSTKTLDEVKQ